MPVVVKGWWSVFWWSCCLFLVVIWMWSFVGGQLKRTLSRRFWKKPATRVSEKENQEGNNKKGLWCFVACATLQMLRCKKKPNPKPVNTRTKVFGKVFEKSFGVLDKRKATIDGGKKGKGLLKIGNVICRCFGGKCYSDVQKKLMDPFIAVTCWGRVLEMEEKPPRGLLDMQKCREKCCGEWYKSNGERCCRPAHRRSVAALAKWDVWLNRPSHICCTVDSRTSGLGITSI